MSIWGRRTIAALFLLTIGLLLALLVALFVPTTSVAAQSKIIYVNAAAAAGGNGSSWNTAYTSLQDALDEAEAGDEIWVAAGIYTPGVNAEDSFNIPPSVAVYGGFAGDEMKRDDRRWETHFTVLSGDIGGDDNVDGRGVVTDTANINNDNAYHVVMLDGTTTPITASTRIDGVIITAGQAYGEGLDTFGGGLFCNGEGAGHECSPTLANVTFAGNLALELGGGMYNRGYDGGVSSPTLTNVTFSGNRADFLGGAMYNAGAYGGVSNPTLTDVTFTDNEADGSGGAIYNDGDNDGVSSPTLTNVIFTNNWAGEYGGAMYNDGAYGVSNPTLTNVTFSGNEAEDSGGAMYNDGWGGGESSPMLINVTFTNNWAWEYGGAMYNDGFDGVSNPTLTNVTFSGNEADDSGGAMYNDGWGGGESSPTLTNVTFSGNWASFYGGAMYNDGYDGGVSNPTLTDVTFTDNGADDSGGAMYNDGEEGVSNPTLIDVSFADNWAYCGGAMYNLGVVGESSPTLTDVTFTDNWADCAGGAMYNDGYDGKSSPTLTNVIFSDNSAPVGGAMYNDGYDGKSSPTLTNVLFAGNSAGFGGAMYNDGSSSGLSNPTLTNVAFTGNWAEIEGGAMYNNGKGGESSPTLTNVTFGGNAAGEKGGAMYNYAFDGGASNLVLTNVILWNNRVAPAFGGDEMYNDGAKIEIANSLVQGGLSGPDSGITNVNGGSVNDKGHNRDLDPRFINSVDPAEAPTTDGDWRLGPGSPAIDAGDNSAVPDGLTTDLDGNPRLQGGVVDMGAYEFQLPDVTLSKSVTPASAQPGQVITYTLLFSNNGLAVATGVVISDDVPAELTNVTVQSSGAVVTETGTSPYTWEAANLAPGAGGIITLTGVVDPLLAADVLLNNVATITAANDNDASNNSDAVVTEVTVPRVSFSAASYSVAEDGGAAVITVMLDAPNPYADVTVHFSTSDGSATAGSDYDAVSQRLTVAAGQTTATVTIPITDDDLDEGDETVLLQLSDPAGAALGAPQTATLTIIDDVPSEPEGYRIHLPLLTMP